MSSERKSFVRILLEVQERLIDNLVYTYHKHYDSGCFILLFPSPLSYLLGSFFTT